MISEALLRQIEKPYFLAPLIAVVVLSLTVLACEIRKHKNPGRWHWRVVVPWIVPLATAAGMLLAVIMFGLNGAGDIASIIALVAAVISLAGGNAVQWAAVHQAGRTVRTNPAAPPPAQSTPNSAAEAILTVE